MFNFMISRLVKMNSLCINFKCIQCCKNTNMLLSDTDIKRIEKLGFLCDFFVNSCDGWLQLKNRDGRCVFHDGMKCLIYEHRPAGCQLYPIIFDKDNNCAILDEECPYRTKFFITQSLRKKLFHLVSRVISERSLRMRQSID